MLKDLTFWTRIASLFLLRSRRATVVLSLMIVSAVTSMIFLSAMCVGINDAMIRNSVTLYAGHISGFNLPSDLAREDLFVGGVANVLKRSPVPGILTRGDRVETIILVQVDPDDEMKSTAMAAKTLSGHYPKKGERDIFVSRSTAEKLQLEPGDQVKFSLGLQGEQFPLTVSGIYQTGFEKLDHGLAFCPQQAIPVPAATWSGAIFLQEGVDPSLVLEKYRGRMQKAGMFESWRELMPDLKQLVDLNYVSMMIVLVLVFAVVSLGVGCAFVIFILKNVSEFGIMKALGVTPWETTKLIFLEVILMNLAASLLAVALGAAMTSVSGRMGIDLSYLTSHNRYFTVSGVIYPRLTPFSLLTPPALAFVSGSLAALWPAFLVVRKKAADILRMI